MRHSKDFEDFNVVVELYNNPKLIKYLKMRGINYF